ncbi:hypothetical protein C789_1870 [Microcystis aeruginosa FACHB-905 = DIANCHI905]|nr:hypothetical protein C789_1870 [Microcystis aeruginosa FACHB-905 = DIANCHI905]
MSIVFALEQTNQLSLLPDKDLVDLCPPIESYQVTKNRILSVARKLPVGSQTTASATELTYLQFSLNVV